MALGTTLPTWPALLFTYLEPITLLLGTHAAFFTPETFIHRQMPVTPTASLAPLLSSAYILAYSLGSVYMLFAMLSVLCTAVTREARVTKFYLAILAVGDVGHLYANFKGMGGDVFWEFGAYNEVMIGNVWITVFLWINRLSTLAGVFGRVARRR